MSDCVDRDDTCRSDQRVPDMLGFSSAADSTRPSCGQQSADKASESHEGGGRGPPFWLILCNMQQAPDHCNPTAAALLIIQCALLVIVLGASAAAAQQVEAPAPAAPLPTPAEPLVTCIKDVRAACIKPICRGSTWLSQASLQYRHMGYKPSLCAM